MASVDQNEPVGNQKLAGTLLPKLLSLAELSISIGNLSVVKYTRELILKTNLAKIYHNSLLTLQMTVAVSHLLVQGIFYGSDFVFSGLYSLGRYLVSQVLYRRHHECAFAVFQMKACGLQLGQNSFQVSKVAFLCVTSNQHII